MKFKLNIYERVILLNILSESCDLLMIGIYQDFLKSLSFTEEEFDKYQICYDGDAQVKWVGDLEKEIKIGDKVLNKIVSIFKSCRENDLLGDEHTEIYNKFVRED